MAVVQRGRGQRASSRVCRFVSHNWQPQCDCSTKVQPSSSTDAGLVCSRSRRRIHPPTAAPQGVSLKMNGKCRSGRFNVNLFSSKMTKFQMKQMKVDKMSISGEARLNLSGFPFFPQIPKCEQFLLSVVQPGKSYSTHGLSISDER